MDSTGLPLSKAQEAELALLIAEQEADDAERFVRQHDISLDLSVSDEGDLKLVDMLPATKGDLSDELFEEDTPTVRLVRDRTRVVVTDAMVRQWWYARHRRKWTLNQIAAHWGVGPRQVREKLATTRLRRGPRAELESRLPVLRKAYEDGARIIDIAQDVYLECGYSSPESCYQGIRKVFIANDVPRRTSNWRHGRTSSRAPKKVRDAYQAERNEIAARRRRQALTRCSARTKTGTRCRRLGPRTVGLCENHAADRTRKWHRSVVLAALLEWHHDRGRWPRSRDWFHATESHPNFKTVYDLFGGWRKAIQAASEHSSREKKLAEAA